MDELVKKISSYHIFNYLIPGVIASFLIDILFNYSFKFIQENIFVGLFFYYFIGSIISRIGSLISPLIDIIFRIKKVDYKYYVTAEKIDSKIDVLSEINNMYRSFYSMFFILTLISLYNLSFTDELSWIISIALLLFFLIYVFSYKKQTGFIVKRVEKTNNKTPT
ncbi:phosphohistidine phosphatase [Arsenophonus nasoniae]|uniref:Phosphohistidine phosphatase n=1 Tax=Arsenophonus nasoniae TaxID=638 RepID=A0AA95G8D0_9GAMM|nr:phosphohistidine phosphatase [Arsenophonus nasoniae]WGL94086.1 phosphohistidine phosphatase [Arsenophonus nasoniae]